MEKIEVGYRNIGSLGGVEFYHKFLLYTDSNGNQFTISGWGPYDPEDPNNLSPDPSLPYGNMDVWLDTPYDSSNPDSPEYSDKNQQQKQFREPITEGEDLSSVWNDMLGDALSKDDLYPYDPLRQNSNSLADALLKDAGLNLPEDDNLFNPLDHWTPGADKELDENLVPIALQQYPLDASEEKLKDWLDGLVGDISDNHTSSGSNTSGDGTSGTNSSSGTTGGNASSGNYGHSSDGSFSNASSPYTGGKGFFGVGGNVRPDTNSFWNSAKNWIAPRYIDPLVLDLDGDGIETLGVNATTHVVFDGDKDGLKTGMGWVKGDDGFLVLDRDGNGTIDNGGELFGDQTLVDGERAFTGFAALSAEDTDGDGTFDTDDTNYANVRVWQDTNQDGISQTDELHTLTELGIASINLTATTTNITTNANVQTMAGSYTKTDGTTGKVGNFNFAQNAFYREFTDEIILTEEAKALPDMQGSGMVRDLQKASTLSSGLTATLQEMQNAGYMTYGDMITHIDIMLSEWADTSTMKSGRTRANDLGGELVYLNPDDRILYHKYLWAQQHNDFSIMSAVEIANAEVLVAKQNRLGEMIDVLERFNADTFATNISMLEAFYNDGTLVSINTTRGLEWHPATEQWTFTAPMEVDLSTAQIAFIEQSYRALQLSVYDTLVMDTRLGSYMDAIDLVIDENGIRVDMSGVIALLDERKQTDAINSVIDCNELKNVISNSFGAIDSTMVMALDSWMSGINNDTEALAAMANSDDVTGLNYKIGTNDDEVLTAGVLNDTVFGFNGKDTLFGKDGNDLLYGNSGSDTLNGNAGSDTLYGGEGDDTLNGDDDNGSGSDTAFADTLIGANGNDLLQGGAGNDTYVFNQGDGIDTIYDYDAYTAYGSNNFGAYNAGNDTIQFGEGIVEGDLSFIASGNDLIIKYSPTDQFTIKDGLLVNNTIENFKLFDGTVVTPKISALTTDNVDTINYNAVKYTSNLYIIDAKDGDDIITTGSMADTVKGGAGNDTLSTQGGDDIVYGDEGNDILNGNGGADTLNGGEGDDTLVGDDDTGYGSDIGFADTLNGGKGNDLLQGGSGNDTYVFNLGDGLDTIYDYDAYTGYGSNNLGAYTGEIDTIQFGEGIVAADLRFIASGNDLIVNYSTEDRITIKDWYLANNTIENIKLFDGTAVSIPSIGMSATEGVDTFNHNTANVYVIDAKDGDDIITTGSMADTVKGGAGNDTLSTQGGDDIVYGDEGNDILNGNGGADTLNGGLGNDTLNGDTDEYGAEMGYADRLIGGTGNDLLQGGSGDDTYMFNLGDGLDTIYDYDAYGSTNYGAYNGEIDTISFGGGIGAGDLSFIASGNNLIVKYSAADQITIKDWYLANNTIENIKLFDGTAVSIPSIGMSATEGVDTFDKNTVHTYIVNGLAGDDSISTGSGSDTLNGGSGNDILNGRIGSDMLNGSEGDDTLVGDNDDYYADAAYADTLIGGTGDDLLKGGAGDDTYVFNLGDGIDTVYDYDRYSTNYSGYNAGSDTLQFGEGIIAADLRFIASGNDLIVNYSTEDRITIKDWYLANNTIENIKLFDGTAVSIPSIGMSATEGIDIFNHNTAHVYVIDALGGDDVISTGSMADQIRGGAGNDTLSVQGGNDSVYGDEGNDILNGNGGADTLNGGEGDDTLVGDNDDYYADAAYADTLIGGTGDDLLKGGAGDDTYVFNLGDGIDTVYDYDRYSTNYSGYNAGNDTLKFGKSISVSDIAVYKNGNDFLLSYGDDDLISITNQSNTNNAIEKFTLSDGNYLTSNDINVIIQSMNAYATDQGIVIDSIDTVKANQDLMNIVAGAWHK